MENEIIILEKLRQQMRDKCNKWINSHIRVGDFTYADNPHIWTWGEGSKLYIGKFCSIAANVHFLLGGNHHTDWCSTYPFNVLAPNICENTERCAATNGNIRIGNDVWIGNDAKIMSGITIGDGAVIAGNAVVTHNVLPYSIVGGVPARHIKYRMNDIIKSHYIYLLKWWNWPIEKLSKALTLLCSSNYEQLIDFNEQWHKDNFDCINYVITHKPYNIQEDSTYKILCVGNYIKDKTFCEQDGYSITQYNDRINELTGLYWIWKNTYSKYIGLCHYSRYFSYNNMRINKDHIKEIMKSYDIILTEVQLDWTVHENILKTISTELDNLVYNKFVQAIKSIQPEYLNAFNEVLNEKYFYNRNMFITSYEIMNIFCEWLFSFILSVTDQIDLSQYDGYSKRAIGYYGEIMWSVWLKKNKLNIFKLPILNN